MAAAGWPASEEEVGGAGLMYGDGRVYGGAALAPNSSVQILMNVKQTG